MNLPTTLGRAPDVPLPLASGFMTADTETGGLVPRSAPLLSIASVAADANCVEVDALHLLVRPPPGCLLELIDVSDPNFDPKVRQPIRGYLELDTGRTRPRSEVNPTEPIIAAAAAFINGFVTRSDSGGYDLRPTERWYKTGHLIHDVDTMMCQFIDHFFAAPPIVVGHNARFDRDFVQHHLPKMSSKVVPTWRCTYRAMQAWYKASQGITKPGKGMSTLSKLAECANIVPDRSHEALADARTCLKGLAWLSRELTKLGVVGASDMPAKESKDD